MVKRGVFLFPEENGIFPKMELECSRQVLVVAVIIIPHICLGCYNCMEFVLGTPFSLGKCFGPAGFHGRLPSQEEALMAASKERESPEALGSPVAPGPFLCRTKVGTGFSAWPALLASGSMQNGL